MAFSTLRQYNVQHAMNPTVQASRGAGGAPGAGSIPTTAQGSPANDYAALGGAGAVGAGILGKFLYDRYKQDQMNSANAGNEIYESAEGRDFSADGPNADVMGGLASNSGGVVYEPGRNGLAAFSSDSDGSQYSFLGSGKAGNAALDGISPLIRGTGLDENLAGLQSKLGFDPITGIWGKLF